MKNDIISMINYLKILSHVIAKTAFWVLALITIFSAFYWYNNTLFLWEAKILWSQEPFSEFKFKDGSPEDRGRMVVDLIQNEKLLGIESNKVSVILGEETGDYYQNDSNFTYRLTNRGKADWILTLVSDDDGKINHVFIRKSCCSISKKMINLGLEVADPFFKALIHLNKEK